MYKIILFGASSVSDKVMKMLDFNKCKVIAYIDNDKTKHGNKMNNIIILPPDQIKNQEFDYIILTSQYYKEMKKQLISLNVNEKYIIEKPSQLFKYDFNNFENINNKFTIISDDCFGAYVYNLLGVKYSSPLIWTFIENEDFIKLLENFDYYIKKHLNFIESEFKYPVAKLDDITVQFMHYENENEAKESWYKRISRINENFYIKMSCNDEHIIKRFDKLPFKNKVCFTYDYYNYKSCIQIKNVNSNGLNWRDNILTAFCDDFDVFKWVK